MLGDKSKAGTAEVTNSAPCVETLTASLPRLGSPASPVWFSRGKLGSAPARDVAAKVTIWRPASAVASAGTSANGKRRKARASPRSSVTADCASIWAPGDGLKRIGSPTSGTLFSSVTRTASGSGKRAPGTPDCRSPEIFVTLARTSMPDCTRYDPTASERTLFTSAARRLINPDSELTGTNTSQT